MTIGDLVPADRTPRKLKLDAARAAAAAGAADGARRGDATQVSGVDDAAIGRLVQTLKTMDPSSAHRIADLRRQIAEGSYTAEPDALAEAFIGRDDDHR